MTNTVFSPVSAIPIFYNGVPAVGAKVHFYDDGTTTPRAIWVNSDASTIASNPVIADGNGVIPPTWVSGTGKYRVVIDNSADVLIRAIDGLEGAAPEVVSPGTSTSYALTTGDTKWNFDTAEQTGFVKLNGMTIGNTASTAHYADDNLLALFSHLWDRLLDSYAAVSGGRGANAAADFNGGKIMTLPDMRLRCPIGLSGMGNSVSTLGADYANANLPGSPVGSNHAALLNASMLPSHKHTGSTSSATGSIFGNTDTDGLHVHTGATTDTAPDHSHTYQKPTDNAILTGTVAVSVKIADSTASTGDAGAHSHAVTVPNTSSAHSHNISMSANNHGHTFITDATGGGASFDVMNPGLTVTFYMKT